MKKTILKLFVVIVVILISINSVKPLIRNLVSKDYTPIEIEQANHDKLDLNMGISHLYNISKKQHPTGSKAIYEVKDYIILQLNKMNVDYEIQTFNYTYHEIYTKKMNKLEDIKNNTYNSLKLNFEKYGLKLEEGLKQIGYDTFEEYYSDNILEGKTNQQAAIEITNNVINKDFFWNKEKNESSDLNNILIKLKSDNANSKAILFVAHYDSAKDSFGAGDNGISVASILEMIRNIKDNKFNNSIYILLTDGEEIGLLGAEYFNKNNPIVENISLVINIDNAGVNGDLFLYQVSNNNSNLIENYLKSTSKDNIYSFTSNVYEYTDWYDTDADVFLENDYNVLNFSLISNQEKYHSENDLIYNIDKNTMKKMMNTLTEMALHYGNCELSDFSEGTSLFFMKLWPGIVACIPEIIYSILTINIILIAIIYIILKIIKNKKFKNVYVYVAYLIYLAIFTQVFTMIIIIFNKNNAAMLLASMIFVLFIIIGYFKYVLNQTNSERS